MLKTNSKMRTVLEKSKETVNMLQRNSKSYVNSING